MAGRPSNRGNRVFFERLESRTLLSAGPRFDPQVGFTRDVRIPIIDGYGSRRAGFGPEWHVGSPDLLRPGAAPSGPRETQGFYGSEFGWRGIGQTSGWEHPQLPHSRPTEFEGQSALDARYSADPGLGPPPVQRFIAELVGYASSGTTSVITVVIAPAKPLVIVRRDDMDPPPAANASPTPPPAPQLPPPSQPVVSGPQPAPSVTSPQAQSPSASTSVVAAAAAPVAPIASGYLATRGRVSVEAAAVPRETAGGDTLTAGAQPTENVGTFAIVVPPATGTIGSVAAAAPVGATTGAIATATAWVRSAAAVVERAFEGSVPDAPQASTFLSPAAYNLLRLNPAALFNDPIARIIGESATLSAPGGRPAHARAWAITGAVVAADMILVGCWHLDRRRKLRAAQKRRPMRLFSASPVR